MFFLDKTAKIWRRENIPLYGIPFSDPSGLISSMQSSNRVLLPNNGGELMLPFTTTNVVSDPLVWLRAVALKDICAYGGKTP